MLKKFEISKNITYLCTAKLAGSAGPFVYRLGRKIFILERAVRLCYGLQEYCIDKKLKSKID